MPPQTSLRWVFPVFDENTTALREFDPRLADHLEAIKGRSGLRTLLYSDIDGASVPTWNVRGVQLRDDFIASCAAFKARGGEVHWISERGVSRGSGNLYSLAGNRSTVRLTGCDGNEAAVNGRLMHFKQVQDISEYCACFEWLYLRYRGYPVAVDIMGYSGIGISISPDHPGYYEYKSQMLRIAQSLLEERGLEYRVKCHRPGIMLERADNIGRHAAVLRIRSEDNWQIGLEIYGGSGEVDIEAEREVNSKLHGFAYKICSNPGDLDAYVARGPNMADHVWGLVDGPEQWARLIEMIAAALSVARRRR